MFIKQVVDFRTDRQVFHPAGVIFGKDIHNLIAGNFLRASTGAAVVRLGEVARVEIGAQTYATSTTLNGKPMAGMAVQLATGANALATAEGVKARMAELSSGLPGDVAWSIPYDTTPFVQASVEEVVKTLVEAMVLVFLVMFLFLQN